MKLFNHKDGHFLVRDNAEIYFEETGISNKPVLILLHGGLGNIEDFNTILPKLPDEFRIIGIDSRGQGKSTIGGKKLSYEILQNDVEAILEHLKIENLCILGFSDGGIVAYRLAAFSKLNIKKLITIGSRWHKKNAEETKTILSGVNADKWRQKFPEMVIEYEKLNAKPDFDKLVNEVVNMWLNGGSYPNENVANIKSDTLIVRGDNDHLIRRQVTFEIAELLQNSNLSNIPFAGHSAHIDQTDIFAITLNEFLRK